MGMYCLTCSKGASRASSADRAPLRDAPAEQADLSPIPSIPRRVRARLFTVIVTLLVLALPASPASAARDTPPRRVISLAPSITREMQDLGAQDMLVGATSYCPLPEGSKVRIVGTPGRINIEQAYSLHADMVLASTDCNSRADVAALERLGCNVRVFSGCEDFACMCASFSDLGVLLGRSVRAEAVLRDVRSRLARIHAGIRSGERPRVFWQLGAIPLVTASDDTFAGEFLRRAGAVNVFGDAPMRYPRVNAEEVLRRDPDVIIVVNQMEPGNAAASWSRFPGMAAVRNGRVHEVSADLVCQPTPVMFIRGLEAVTSALYQGVP